NFYLVKEETATYGYRIIAEESQQEVIGKLEELRTAVERGDLKPWQFQGIEAIFFNQHLYQPLLYAEGDSVQIAPAPLNKGERRFVHDLKVFCDGKPAVLEGNELYLLRNLSKGRSEERRVGKSVDGGGSRT